MPRRRALLQLHGSLQGIGFRPFAVREARALGLAGHVRNAGDGVEVALEGAPDAIDAWLRALAERPPPGAVLETQGRCDVEPRGDSRFRILTSQPRPDQGPPRVPPDIALCAACRDDLFDPDGRRHRYAFTHCARCGPRASVLRGLPYDRERTSLADFPPCKACLREYADPGDRRFHAQTVACPACGPRLSLRDTHGREQAGDAVEGAATALRAGASVAVKGYGGYHLVADARSAEAVERLRKRKGRPTKPFAVLVPDLVTAHCLAELGHADEQLLAGPPRAVVIAPRRREGCAALGLAPGVAPRTGDVGLLLPHAPLHELLLFARGTRPGRDPSRFAALIFTSANRSGEPTEWDAATARAHLAEIADLFLDHDREVARPSDDSVFRSAMPGPLPIRLSRGAAPRVFPAPDGCRQAAPGLAVGGDLKCAPAVIADGEIHLGAHVGDLASAGAADALEARAAALAAPLATAPRWVAHDLHPGYHGTHIAQRLAPLRIAVQHHHAHAIACLVEHQAPFPALALVLDGAGYGTDGSVWGGELLEVTLSGFERLAHLECVPLPGGDAAAREPWRMAAVWLERAFPTGAPPRLPWHARRDSAALATLLRLAQRGVNAPPTSSCGRLFDAAASLLDCGDAVTHEGEAAMALESLASEVEAEAEPQADRGASAVLPAADLIRAVATEIHEGVPPARIARRFHTRLAARLAAAAISAARTRDIPRVALSGGCFQNRLLLEDVHRHLTAAGLEPLLPRQIPPNDAGLAIGQAAIAAHKFSELQD